MKEHSLLVEIQTWWLSCGRELGGIYVRVFDYRFEFGITKMMSREEEERALKYLAKAQAKTDMDHQSGYSAHSSVI